MLLLEAKFGFPLSRQTMQSLNITTFNSVIRPHNQKGSHCRADFCMW